jgi:phage baseplate assembly protein gpV
MTNTVYDSSLWTSSHDMASLYATDSSIKIGTVRSEYINLYGQTQYVVETFVSGNIIPIPCVVMSRFGGVQNYEEYRLRSYKAASTDDRSTNTAYMPSQLKAGDQVIVACLQGSVREGVILGGILHPARKETTKLGELAYISEFNGIEQTISKDGAYRVTFKAPITTSLDNAIPGQPIPPQILNTIISGTYYELSKDGSWIISDNKSQLIKIDKTATAIQVTSGKATLQLDGAGSKLSISAPKEINLKTDSLMALAALDFKLNASKSLSMKSPKIAIGNSNFELMDGLVKLIDLLGQTQTVSPTGLNTTLNTTPVWPKIEKIKLAIQATKGSLS